MNFIEKLSQTIVLNKLFEKNQNLLAAVSGGIDSVVLVRALKELNYTFSIAHVNFNLRGSESNDDEHFVKLLAKSLNIPFLVKRFDTKNLAEQRNESIQELARNLRYEWFKELQTQNKFDAIVTAHHANDLTETIIFNLIRGTGLNGLTSLTFKSNGLTRPMLYFTRNEIEIFANENKIEYRKDSSNESDKYSRNFIRHHVIPNLIKANKHSIENILHHHPILIAQNNLLKEYILKLKHIFTIDDRSSLTIYLDKVKTHPQHELILYEFIKDYGFNSVQVNNMLSQGLGSKKYLAKEYIATVKNNLIKVEPKKSKLNDCTFNLGSTQINFNDYTFKTELLPNTDIDYNADKNCVYLNADLLQQELMLRQWKSGDRFKPFGLAGHKLVSDFLTNLKLDAGEKETICVLVSKNDIAAVIPFRINDKYKVTYNTQAVLKLTQIKKRP